VADCVEFTVLDPGPITQLHRLLIALSRITPVRPSLVHLGLCLQFEGEPVQPMLELILKFGIQSLICMCHYVVTAVWQFHYVQMFVKYTRWWLIYKVLKFCRVPETHFSQTDIELKRSHGRLSRHLQSPLFHWKSNNEVLLLW